MKMLKWDADRAFKALTGIDFAGINVWFAVAEIFCHRRFMNSAEV